MRSCPLKMSHRCSIGVRRFAMLLPGQCFLPLIVVVACAGCGPPRPKFEVAEVSGKVMYKGKPLPGGRVTFTSDLGGLSDGANLDKDGNYKVMAPVGAVHVTVDNRSLQARRGPEGPRLSRPGSELPDDKKGQFYVRIPDKYYDPTKTDLTFTVVAGPEPQNFEITLKD